ncbi:MAG TPA: DUF4160 domain-containing protein [Thermoanaerobaculia bacterium]|jgi:hypothetical protein|nr:DUF4160 domain-containing protein [Thermoanaerobaculia bacterium]
MPTIFRSGPYRFFFYSGDRTHPPHVHVEGAGGEAKFWLSPVRLHSSEGFGRVELARLQQLIEEHKDAFSRSWNEFFSL